MGPLAILGPGTLGTSAAQWSAECGLETRLLGRNQAHAGAGLESIHRRWDQAVSRGQISHQVREKARAKLTATALSPSALEGVSMLLEALPEDPDLKGNTLASLARMGGTDLQLLSGTSALSIADLAHRAGLVGQLVGFHLFVPVPRMAVVEMAVAPGTDSARVDQVRALGLALRKRVIQVRDQPGFAAARMALAQGLEAMKLLEAGVASAEDLDALMTLGYGHPIGPLELSDRVGLNLRLCIAEGLEAAGEARFQPPAILRAKVARGATGTEARRGFHAWDDKGRRL